MQPRDVLAQLLRPAGGGIYVVSTGASEQLAMQERLYGVTGEAEVRRRFAEELDRIAAARVVVLGVPSDVGAGFLRGANMGPQAIRAALLDAHPSWPDEARALGVVDAGDVLVTPQLLHDEMLSAPQIRASQDALYPSLDEAARRAMAVSPLSMESRALEAILAINPDAKPLVLGGDHSCAWPVVETLAKARREPWGIVQIDAHTDLLKERLGVRYCFATWSYHANELLGRGGKLVQVGIRATRHDRGHWEGSLGVRQFWARECLADPSAALDAIVAHVERTGVRSIYFSNDIDGTDARFADATGTPEAGGLAPDFVLELIRRLQARVGLCAGDVMEVAPAIPRTPGGRERTLETAVRYFRETAIALAS
ncbi:MAG TPA: arginase family protein [Polyangiaceae bacterium]|nr:arginase family protein [Polyangiaceae bacterium]